jgi:succinylglutamate desuccinylase|tara:strand:- start:857 stop:1120 length:264 start_codon:yes stop_codon:yes gene_type:complete
MKKVRFLTILLIALQQEELDINKMFQDAKWEEVQNTTNQGYEVEKVTIVAGVRGNEAEHEILDFLYYRVRSNTPQIPSKLAEKLHIR